MEVSASVENARFVLFGGQAAVYFAMKCLPVDA